MSKIYGYARCSTTVDCRTGQIDPMSQAFIQMSAVFAELELSIIRARVKSGIGFVDCLHLRMCQLHLSVPKRTSLSFSKIFDSSGYR